jgi:hypothetical protein
LDHLPAEAGGNENSCLSRCFLRKTSSELSFAIYSEFQEAETDPATGRKFALSSSKEEEKTVCFSVFG